AALRAEAPLHMVRGLEALRLTPGPFQLGVPNGDQRSVEIAKGFLAHAAVADRRIAERALHTETHGPALAAAGVDRFVIKAHHCLLRWRPILLTASPPNASGARPFPDSCSP